MTLKTNIIIADFIVDAGYDVKIIDVPFGGSSAGDLVHLLVLGKDRDGVAPVWSSTDAPHWCIIKFLNHGGRPAFDISVEARPFDYGPLNRDGAKVMFLDEPGALAGLVAYLDHWYFRVFQRD